MATGTELVVLVRDQTLLDSDDVSDATILAHLNRAISTVGVRFAWPFLNDADTFDSEVGTRAYAFPTGCIYIDAIVEDDKRRRLKEIGRMDAWDRYGDSPPSKDATAFYLWAEQIELLELPSQVLTYNVFFRKQPTLMATLGGTPEWNDQFHNFLSEYAIAKLWEREEDRQLSADAMDRFDEGIGEMASFYMNQAQDNPMVWGERPDRATQSRYANMPWLDGV